MKKIMWICAVVLILLAMGGCDSYATPAAGMRDTASPEAAAQTAANMGATPDPAATPAPQTPTPPAADATAPVDTAPPPTASPTSTPAATATPAPKTAAPTATSSASSSGVLKVAPITGTAAVESYLPLRASPSSASALLKKIPKDAELTVIKVAQNAQWLKVTYSGETGYVFSKYVKIGGDAANRVCTVTSGAVNMHTGAGKKFDVLGILESGATVVVTAQAKASTYTWYEVTASGKKGYVCGVYCRLSAS